MLVIKKDILSILCIPILHLLLLICNISRIEILTCPIQIAIQTIPTIHSNILPIHCRLTNLTILCILRIKSLLLSATKSSSRCLPRRYIDCGCSTNNFSNSWLLSTSQEWKITIKLWVCSNSINNTHNKTMAKKIRTILAKIMYHRVSSKKLWTIKNILSSIQNSMVMASKEDISTLQSTINSSKVLLSIHLSTIRQLRDNLLSGSKDFSTSMKNSKHFLRSMKYWTSKVLF